MPHTKTRASRSPRAAFLACAVVVAASLALGTAPAGAAKKPKPIVDMVPGEVTVYKVAGDPTPLPDDVRNAVMATLAGYVNAATVKPLQKGRAADDAVLAGTLAPVVAARLTGPDRAVLVDEGLPKAVSKIRVGATPIALTGLVDGDGRVVLVTAKLDSTTTTKTAKGKLSIKRAGELVLTPETGTWKISGYTLTVDRLGKGLGLTTTTTAPAAPAAAPTPTTVAR